MPSRPDLREIAANVKEAFGDMDRETLLEILTFVVKEYVVEGPPPMLVHQAETLSDLKNATFAQVIAAMQTRFDHAEWQMFAVDGERVSVKIGGVMQPVLASRDAAGVQAAELPRPAAGVRVVETTLQQRPPQAAQPPRPAPAAQAPAPPAQAGQAPPPARGLSLRGRPSGDAAGPPPAPPAPGVQPAPSPPAAQGQPAPGQGAAPAAPDKDKPESGDDASARFSLLELD